jgi:hypothetical protein
MFEVVRESSLGRHVLKILAKILSTTAPPFVVFDPLKEFLGDCICSWYKADATAYTLG